MRSDWEVPCKGHFARNTSIFLATERSDRVNQKKIIVWSLLSRCVVVSRLKKRGDARSFYAAGEGLEVLLGKKNHSVDVARSMKCRSSFSSATTPTKILLVPLQLVARL